METWRAFRAFIAAALGHWIKLGTGGFVILMVGLIEHFTRDAVSWPIYAAMIAALFMWACFLAFRDQHVRAEVLQKDLSNSIDASNKMSHSVVALEELKQAHAGTKAELDELLATVGPSYPFNLAQRKTLVGVLTSVPAAKRFDLRIMFPSSGGGPSAAHKIADAFAESGWSVDVVANLLLRGELRGINVTCSHLVWRRAIPMPEKAQLIIQVLDKAGIAWNKCGPSEFPGDNDLFQFIVPAAG